MHNKNFNAPLFLALQEFISNNGGKPHLICSEKGISNPALNQYVRNGVIVLNVSYQACQLNVSDDGINFSGRFAGAKQDNFFPWEDVLSIGDANGVIQDGWAFSTDHAYDLRPLEEEPATPVVVRPKFGVVQGGKD